MKRHYSSHKYSGYKVNPMRSRGSFKRHSGVENSRSKAWREENIQCKLAAAVHSESVPVKLPLSSATEKIENEISKLATYYNKNHKKVITAVTAAAPSHEFFEVEWPQHPNAELIDKHEFILEKDGGDGKGLLNLDGGYRIVDIQHVLKWALTMQSNHNKKCTLGKMQLCAEQREGLHSYFTFKCNMCEATVIHKSEESAKINKACVWGSLTSGSYHAQTHHILSTMDIPAISATHFRDLETEIADVWETELLCEIQQAGSEEKKIAMEKGHIDSDGVPYITVCVDGGWSKRSYGHNFSAASGIACIIGKETKKCLFLGVKNKYCTMCAYNEKHERTNEHLCFKNYEGSSTGMESTILVEGFCRSIEMHGVRYKYFVGDGDSSVFARLKTKVPYGNIIKKMECKNHVVKTYTKDLYKILAERRFDLAGRKIIDGNINKLTVVARMNIINCKNDASKLREDFKNGVLHVFGDHTNCATYYCNKKSSEKEKNKDDVPPLAESLKLYPAVWGQLQAAIEKIIKKADRLVTNETNNMAENFMSLVAKFTCGKRINFTKSGAYTRRAHLAGLYQISGYRWVPKAWKKAILCSPGHHHKKYLLRKDIIAERRKKYKRRRIFPAKASQLQKADKDYGPKADDPPPEMTDKELFELCESKRREFQVNPLWVFLTRRVWENLKQNEIQEHCVHEINSQTEINNLERQSVGQHGNAIYDMLRKDRLTASNFGMVCKRRQRTPCHNHVKIILYKSEFSNDDTRYGQKFEKIAIAIFEKESNNHVTAAGLFIDPEYGFLGASPDGIVIEENALVEVKCFPSISRQMLSLEEAAKTKNNFPLKYEDGTLHINKKHNFYYQIQGQLRVCQKDKCYLICFIDLCQSIKVLTIEKDEKFINEMIPKLVNFYEKFVLPEIVLRRVLADQKCRDVNLNK